MRIEIVSYIHCNEAGAAEADLVSSSGNPTITATAGISYATLAHSSRAFDSRVFFASIEIQNPSSDRHPVPILRIVV